VGVFGAEILTRKDHADINEKLWRWSAEIGYEIT